MLNIKALKAMSRRGEVISFSDFESYHDAMEDFITAAPLDTREKKMLNVGLHTILERNFYTEFIARETNHVTTCQINGGRRTMFVIQEWVKVMDDPYRVTLLEV